MNEIFRFRRLPDDPLATYVMSEVNLPAPVWPGLWQGDYPDDPVLSPFLRYGVNNVDGEALAVWRALAWALTEGTQRWAIPTFDRDAAAEGLGVAREEVTMVSWEYKVDTAVAEFPGADRGFVPARSCVPVESDRWQRRHRHHAGLFALHDFADLTALELAVQFDSESEITLFGLAAGRTGADLAAGLDGPRPPRLADVLRPGDVFVDLTVFRDRFGDLDDPTSHLTVRSTEPLDERLAELVDHYHAAFGSYVRGVDQIHTFEDFGAAMDELLRPPTPTR